MGFFCFMNLIACAWENQTKSPYTCRLGWLLKKELTQFNPQAPWSCSTEVEKNWDFLNFEFNQSLLLHSGPDFKWVPSLGTGQTAAPYHSLLSPLDLPPATLLLNRAAKGAKVGKMSLTAVLKVLWKFGQSYKKLKIPLFQKILVKMAPILNFTT